MWTRTAFLVTLFPGLLGCNELFDIGSPKVVGEGGSNNSFTLTTTGGGGGGDGGSGGTASTTTMATGGGASTSTSTSGTGGGTSSKCGNGTVDVGEQCDPGADGFCSPGCQNASITAITAGDAHTCILISEDMTKKGYVKCWGDNTYGQLGTGSPETLGDDPDEMGATLPVVDLGVDANPIALVAGGTHTCAILTVNEPGGPKQKLKCWGNNLYGQLGLGDKLQRGNAPDQMGDNLLAVDVGADLNVVSVAPGQLHTCAAMKGGAVKCWGSNAHNQVGLDDVSLKIGDDPMEMGNLLSPVTTDVLTLASGEFFTCGIYTSGQVRCWGMNSAAQLGIGSTDEQPILDKIGFVELFDKATGLKCGNNQTCAQLENQDIRCWGKNDVGQIGQISLESFGDDPMESVSLPSLTVPGTPLAFAMGGNHGCGEFGPAGFRCWGNNSNGQLGLGTTFTPNFFANAPAKVVPVEVGGGFTAKTIAVGEAHTCAVSTKNRIKCWGKNGGGQLGLGHSADVGLQNMDMGENLPTVKVISTMY